LVTLGQILPGYKRQRHGGEGKGGEGDDGGNNDLSRTHDIEIKGSGESAKNKNGAKINFERTN